MKLSLKVFLSLFLCGCILPASADDLIAVAKEGNVYDQANAKYVTENQNGDGVSVIPGMVFTASEHTPGWYKIEYSPGLHAYLPDQLIASSFNEPKPGTYKVANNPSESIRVINNGNNWSAQSNGKSFNGSLKENILIFVDDDNRTIYSLVDLGNGPIVITYDNAVTKFF